MLKFRPGRRGVNVLAAVLVAGLMPVASTSAVTGLPRLPTQLTGRHALEVRPAVISWTGDGTGYLGGLTRQSSIPPGKRSLRQLGRLRWTRWTATRAQASGAVWLNDGIPDDAEGTFYSYAATVQASRPREGLFTRLAFSYRYQGRERTTRLKAVWFPPQTYNGFTAGGYWAWQAASVPCINTCP